MNQLLSSLFVLLIASASSAAGESKRRRQLRARNEESAFIKALVGTSEEQYDSTFWDRELAERSSCVYDESNRSKKKGNKSKSKGSKSKSEESNSKPKSRSPTKSRKKCLAHESAKLEWTKLHLLAGDVEEYDGFGRSVATDGNTIVVGADIWGSFSESGHIYIFTRSSPEQSKGGHQKWALEAKIFPADGMADDRFGRHVAIDGDGETIVVGSKRGTYVYTKTGATSTTKWELQAKLLAPARHDGGLAIFGDTIVVGIGGANDGMGEPAGAVFVFTRSGRDKTWKQQAKIVPPDLAREDSFGKSVAIYEDTIVVGSPGDDDRNENSGSVYVFTRSSGGVWSLHTKILPESAHYSEYFGGSIGIYGDTIIVGAPGLSQDSEIAGSVYVFVRSADGRWKQKAKIIPDDSAVDDEFGASLSIDGDNFVVGTDRLSSNKAYIFTRSRDDGAWKQRDTLRTTGSMYCDSVSIRGDTIVIGASWDEEAYVIEPHC